MAGFDTGPPTQLSKEIKMLMHEEFKARALQDPEVRAEYERLDREEVLMLDAILKARAESGLIQAQVDAKT